MKTILEINGTNYGSSGTIALNIAKEARNSGFKVYTSCKNSRVSKRFNNEDQIYIGLWSERIISSVLSYITGLRDHFNILGTYFFINKIKKINPNLIHLHVLHDTFINYNILFNYIKKNNIPTVWTFHDCCGFTGQCPHFQMAKCDKWKTGCHNCPQLHVEPESLIFDTTKHIYNWKKNLYGDLNNLTIVTPSKWLADIVKESFLKDKDIRVINNGIDLDIFKPRESDFKSKYNVDDKYIILGVANAWVPRKGLDDFIELSKTLPSNYQIVLVGTNDEVDKKLPDNIISIHRTYDQKELAEIYTSADVFFNPTKEENFPTVNIESLACGTPVLTYKTGGSPEIIDEKSGYVLPTNDFKEAKNKIVEICENNLYKKEDCINRAQLFNRSSCFTKYVDLYKEIIEPGI